MEEVHVKPPHADQRHSQKQTSLPGRFSHNFFVTARRRPREGEPPYGKCTHTQPILKKPVPGLVLSTFTKAVH